MLVVFVEDSFLFGMVVLTMSGVVEVAEEKEVVVVVEVVDVVVVDAMIGILLIVGPYLLPACPAARKHKINNNNTRRIKVRLDNAEDFEK